MTEKEILLTSILGCPLSQLYTQKPSLSFWQLKKLNQAFALRAQGFPLQYILGEVEFFGLKFKVDNRVLIPRPETEILVEEIIRRTKDVRQRFVAGEGRGTKIRILDIGTGSGCIAVSLAKFILESKITALDISLDALSLARENAALNQVDDKIQFIQSDALSAVSFQPSAFDLIISNPPYLRSGDIQNLQPELGYEPRIALDGGSDGLDFYRRIIRESRSWLKEEGYLFLEIGFSQKEAIEEIINQNSSLRLLEVIKDYSGLERILILKKWIN